MGGRDSKTQQEVAVSGVLVEGLEQAEGNKMVGGQKTVCVLHIHEATPRHIGA